MENGENNLLDWLISKNIISTVPTLFFAFVFGYVLQEQLEHPVKSSKYSSPFSTIYRSLTFGMIPALIAVTLSLPCKDYIIQQITDFNIVNSSMSLFDAYILISLIIFYPLLFGILYLSLRYINKSKTDKQVKKLKEPLYK